MSIADRSLSTPLSPALDDVAREAKALTLPSWHHARVLDIDLHDLEIIALEQGAPECTRTWAGEGKPRWSIDRGFEQPAWARGAA